LEKLCHWLINDYALLRERKARVDALRRPNSAAEVAESVRRTVDSGRIPHKEITAQMRDRLRSLLQSFSLLSETEQIPPDDDPKRDSL
jgi:hypothetical protein